MKNVMNLHFMNRSLLVTALVMSGNVQAELTTLTDADQMEFRRNNAVLLYEFNDPDDKIVRDSSRIGAPLNLRIFNGLGETQVSQNPGYVEIKSTPVIKSETPATKLYNTCRSENKGVTVEVWFQNNDSQELRTGRFPGNTFQPARIVSYSESILRNNLTIGQFYDGADFLAVAMNTNGIENPAQPGASLSNLLRSDMGETILHTPENINTPQQMIVTLTPEAVTRVYLSDRTGNLSRRQLTSTGFQVNNNQIFQDWYPDASFAIGNLPATIQQAQDDKNDYRGCSQQVQGPDCGHGSRSWKGKIHLVAVYCKALTDAEILGSKAQQSLAIQPFDIDVNLNITPELRRAQKIYSRVAGVRAPIFHPALKEMEQILLTGANADPAGKASVGVQAAEIATRDANFLNVTVRDLAAPMSNRAMSRDVPLNDFTATFMGIVADEVDARKMLYENIVYEANSSIVAVPSSEVNDKLRSNSHYSSLEAQRVDLSKNPKRDPANFPTEGRMLIPRKQRVFNGTAAVDVPDTEAGGLLTTRTYLQEQCIAGTNRRCIEKIFEHFLCLPLDRVSDSSGPDNVVGKDIDRDPGGSFTKFTTNCKACHTIMDSMRPAFAYWTFNNNYAMNSTLMLNIVNNDNDENNGLGFRGSQVPGANLVHYKYNKGDIDNLDPQNPYVRPGAYVTSNKWTNNANFGSNAKRLGWKTKEADGVTPSNEWQGGRGVRSLGKAFSETKQFPICMATRVFNQVCGRDPVLAEASFVDSVVKGFKERNYNMKYLFQRIGSSDECLGKN